MFHVDRHVSSRCASVLEDAGDLGLDLSAAASRVRPYVPQISESSAAKPTEQDGLRCGHRDHSQEGGDNVISDEIFEEEAVTDVPSAASEYDRKLPGHQDSNGPLRGLTSARGSGVADANLVSAAPDGAGQSEDELSCCDSTCTATT